MSYDEARFLEDNIATLAFHLGRPGARLNVSYDKGALAIDPGEVLKEASRRLSLPAQGAQDALRAIYEWYDRDGSVGAASEIFEANRSALTKRCTCPGESDETPHDGKRCEIHGCHLSGALCSDLPISVRCPDCPAFPSTKCPPLNKKTRCDACNLREPCSDPACPNAIAPAERRTP